MAEFFLEEFSARVAEDDLVDEDELLLKPESADEFEESSTPRESFRGLLTLKVTSLSLSTALFSKLSLEVLLRFLYLVFIGIVQIKVFRSRIFE